MREALYREAQGILLEESPCIAFNHRQDAILLRSRWRGIPFGLSADQLELERAVPMRDE